VELLGRACEAAGVQVPGVGPMTFRFECTPKGEQIIKYLVGAFTPELVEAVQRTIFRFHDACAALVAAEESQAAGMVTSSLLEDLKRTLFYMARAYVDFEGDPVLRQLFPAPKGAKPAQAKQPLTAVDRLRERMAKDALLHKVETFAAGFEERMGLLKLIVSMIDGRRLGVDELLKPEARRARLAFFGMASDKPLQNRLRELVNAHAALRTQLTAVHQGGGDLDALRQSVVSISAMALALRQHPLTADLLAVPPESLFPTEESLDEQVAS
jgi:hypothetical protein